MPFDLLYLHAAYFIYIKMDSNNINKNFIKAKNDLLKIFESLDKILRGIWDKLKEKENYTYTEKDTKEIANLVLEYFVFMSFRYNILIVIIAAIAAPKL